MQLKTDPHGQPLLDDRARPILIDDQGHERPWELPELVATLDQLDRDLADQRQQAAQLTERLAAWNDLDPERARAAVDRLAQLDADAATPPGQLRARLEADYAGRLRERDDAIARHQQQIRDLVVKSAFDASAFLRDQTLLVPDMAYVYFGDLFRVEERDGHLVPVAHLDGQPLLSPSRPGQPASPDEALRLVIQQHPQGARMLRAGHQSGPGGGGSRNPQPDTHRHWHQMTLDEQARYVEQHGPQAARALIDANA